MGRARCLRRGKLAAVCVHLPVGDATMRCTAWVGGRGERTLGARKERGSHPGLHVGRGSSALSVILRVGPSSVTPLVTEAAREVSVTCARDRCQPGHLEQNGLCLRGFPAALGACWSWQGGGGGGRLQDVFLITLAAAGAAHLHFVLLTEYVYLLILLGRGKDFGLVAQPERSRGELRKGTFA